MSLNTKPLYTIFAVIAVAPCLFFTYYTVRLIYVNLTMNSSEAAAHRTGGMLIGAIAFPLAAVVFGFISWWFFRKSIADRS